MSKSIFLQLLALTFFNSIYKTTTENCNDKEDNLDYDLYPNYGKDWLYFCTEEGDRKVIFVDPAKDPNLPPDIVESAFDATKSSDAFITDDVHKSSVHFYLYNKDDRKNGTKVEASRLGIANSKLDKAKETIFLCHGFAASYLIDNMQELKDAYLVSKDYNIITIDWGHIAKIGFYPIPMAAAKAVGNYVAKFIDEMIAVGFDPDRIHLVGHSLGAHVVGFAGQSVKEKIARVTGLDPALPGYMTAILTGGKISKESAKFVDVIHTCGGIYGIAEPLGHVDIYPNDGVSPQPGCGKGRLESAGCSHTRSWRYFKESINRPYLFPSVSCSSFTMFLMNACSNDTVLMGEPTLNTARGRFYLLTNPDLPYGKGTEFA